MQTCCISLNKETIKCFFFFFAFKGINLEIMSSDSYDFQISFVASLPVKTLSFSTCNAFTSEVGRSVPFFLNKVQQLCQLHTVLSQYCLHYVLLLILPPCKCPKCPSLIQRVMNEITFYLPNLFVNSFD